MVKTRIWRVKVGSNWTTKDVVAVNVKSAIQKVKSKLLPFEKRMLITEVVLIAEGN